MWGHSGGRVRSGQAGSLPLLSRALCGLVVLWEAQRQERMVRTVHGMVYLGEPAWKHKAETLVIRQARVYCSSFTREEW